MSYFDFHLHTLFKHVLTHIDPAERLDCRLPVAMRPRLPELEFIIDSQSCPAQIMQPGATYCCALIALERGFAAEGLIRTLGPLLTPLDRNFLGMVANNRVAYWKLLNDELTYTMERLQACFPAVQFLHPQAPETAPDKTGILFCVEGGHCFMDGRNPPEQNLRAFKKAIQQKGAHLLYMTLTHLTRINEPLQQEELCTFAYGMKLVKNSVYYPRGFGIRPAGVAMIKEAYSREGDTFPVIIDIRHMSLLSRRQLYRLRRQELAPLITLNGPQFPVIPLIASHAGVTGLSWAEFADSFTAAGPVNDPVHPVRSLRMRRPLAAEEPVKVWFNPWSINLFDEDIQEIVASGGMIGISADQRVLGFDPLLARILNGNGEMQAEEYFSEAEFNALDIDPDILQTPLPEVKEAAAPAEKELLGIGEQLFNKRRHSCHFAANVIHVWRVAYEWYLRHHPALEAAEAADRAWEHICMGSDFDGLIDPINSFTSIDQLPSFQQWLRKVFRKTFDSYCACRGLPALPIAGKRGLDNNMEHLLHLNGKRFVKAWLQEAGG